MFRSRRAILGGLAVILAAIHPAWADAAGEEVTLRLRPAEGTTWEQRVTFSQTLSMAGLGGVQLLARNLVLGLSFEVTRVDPARGTLVTGTYRSLFYSQSDATGVSTWDSANPSADVPKAIENTVPLLGRRFTVSIDPEGVLGEIEGADPAVNAFVRGILPSGTVRLGQSWKRSITLDGTPPLVIDAAMFLDQKGEQTVRQQVVAEIRQPPGTPAVDFGSVVKATDVRGSMDGPIHLDLESGWPFTGRLAYRIKGSLFLDTGPRLPFNLSAPLTGEGEIIIEML
jgi:hypothetical protein